MKKRAVRHRVARSALVVLRDGSCLWFQRATVKRSRTGIRVRTADGVEVVVPAGTGCLTYDAVAKKPEPIEQLVEAIDEIQRGSDGWHQSTPSPKPRVDPRRLARICKKHRIKRLSLFGSVVRDDDFGPASDVDILYEPEDGHHETLATLVAANEAFADLFGRRVDFINRSLIESSKNPHRRQSIFEDERVVYQRMVAPDLLGCSRERDGAKPSSVTSARAGWSSNSGKHPSTWPWSTTRGPSRTGSAFSPHSREPAPGWQARQSQGERRGRHPLLRGSGDRARSRPSRQREACVCDVDLRPERPARGSPARQHGALGWCRALDLQVQTEGSCGVSL